MNISKEDLFLDNQPMQSGANAILDFHSHGDDVLRHLAWFVHTTGTQSEANIVVNWTTSDEISDNEETLVNVTVAFRKEFTAIPEDGYLVKFEALPSGLKRYNTIGVTNVSGNITAGIVDGRDAGTPFVGV